jgi:uncharacterized damage-inducible protein DinB
MSTSSLLTSLYKFKAWSNEDLFTTLQQLNATDHADELHSALRILNHIHVVDKIFRANLQGIAHHFEATNTPETPTLNDLHAAVRETDKWYVTYVGGLDQSSLSQSIHFTFTDQGGGQMTREEMLAHVVTHGGYHRGAVGRILAQLSIKPPRDIYTKFLHDTEPARRQS